MSMKLAIAGKESLEPLIPFPCLRFFDMDLVRHAGLGQASIDALVSMEVRPDGAGLVPVLGRLMALHVVPSNNTASVGIYHLPAIDACVVAGKPAESAVYDAAIAATGTTSLLHEKDRASAPGFLVVPAELLRQLPTSEV